MDYGIYMIAVVLGIVLIVGSVILIFSKSDTKSEKKTVMKKESPVEPPKVEPKPSLEKVPSDRMILKENNLNFQEPTPQVVPFVEIEEQKKKQDPSDFRLKEAGLHLSRSKESVEDLRPIEIMTIPEEKEIVETNESSFTLPSLDSLKEAKEENLAVDEDVWHF